MTKIKSLANSLPAIAGLFLAMNLVGAWLFILFEKGYAYGDAVYWAFITSLSIGYGDISPATPAGRVLAIALAVCVLLIIVPLIVGHIVMGALEDRNAFTDEEQEEIKVNISLMGAKLDDTLFILNGIDHALMERMK